MRHLALTFLALAALSALSAEPPVQPYPLWDGQETVAEYAKRTGLEPTKTLDLGNGVKLELVLIPAGKFVMGMSAPPSVNEWDFRSRILTGQVVLAVGAGVLLVLLSITLVRAIRRRERPQYSLAWFLAMTVAAGVGLLGGLHWFYAAQSFDVAQREYQTGLANFTAAEIWEKPAHEVTLTKPYYIGMCEVTQEQYQQVMGNNPSHFKGYELPVEMVSWNDAQSFCKKVSERTGLIVRLPTEAQWEHACRAGTKTTYYTGDSEADLDQVAWCNRNSNQTTHPVGQKTPNAWGVHDTHGNVWEWCQDRDMVDYKAKAVVDPQDRTEGPSRVFRGGSYDLAPRDCSSTLRLGDFPTGSLDFGRVGFRVAASVPSSP